MVLFGVFCLRAKYLCVIWCRLVFLRENRRLLHRILNTEIIFKSQSRQSNNNQFTQYVCLQTCFVHFFSSICLILPLRPFNGDCTIRLEFFRVFRFGILFILLLYVLLLLPLIKCGACWSSQYKTFWFHANRIAHDSSSSSHLTQIRYRILSSDVFKNL